MSRSGDSRMTEITEIAEATPAPPLTLSARLGLATGLTRTDEGTWRYVRRAWLWSLIPSLLISGALGALGLMEHTPGPDALDQMSAGTMLLLVLVFAPLGETMILAGGLAILGRFWRNRKMWELAAVSAIVWGLLHFANGPTIPLVVSWPFFIFSIAFLVWRPYGWWRAYGICAAIHFLQNLLPALALLVS